MKALIRISFSLDDGEDILECQLTVPSNVSEAEIAETIKKEYKYMYTEDKEGVYGTNGRNTVTLLDHICRKYGWLWSVFDFDIDLDFH